MGNRRPSSLINRKHFGIYRVLMRAIFLSCLLILPDSQTAVCNGLVIDHLHQLKNNQAILSTRRCHSSYGIIVNKLYTKKKASSWLPAVKKSPVDEENYALNQIQWLIRQGEEINCSEPIRRRFCRITAPENREESWNDIIAWSNASPDCLPRSLYEGDAKQVGKITSRLNWADFTEDQHDIEQKKKSYYGIKLGKEYLKVNLEVRVFISFADLRFETWLQHSHKCIGKQDEDITVQWKYTGGGWMGRQQHEARESEEEMRLGSDTWPNSLLSVEE
jgi:hypothetical protein